MNVGNILKAFDINLDYENVNNEKKYEITDVPKECSDVLEPDGKRRFYTLEKTKYLEGLFDRLVIEWGRGEISWHQWYIKKGKKVEKGEKKIIEILPKGFFTRFHGFLNFSLPWHKLEKIIKNEEAHQDWYYALSNVKGVYLITDETDGKHYIGSAYNEKGIWGRWKNYIETKDGGSKKLSEILNTDPERYKSFRFSILEILPNSSTNDEVIHQEKIAKEKLGSSSFGLNLN